MEEIKTHYIDAKNQILGRIATQAVVLLRGKNKKTFTPNRIIGDKVVIFNARQVKVTGKKLQEKIYYRHSSYPGSLKKISLEKLLDKKPQEVIYKAVRGMLPDNKLRNLWLKNLIIKEGENE